MKTHEQKFTEAIEALTFRLKTWGVDDPEAKAREFMRDLTHHGWRGSMPELNLPRPVTPADPETVAAIAAAAREELARVARAAIVQTNQEEAS